MNEMVMNNLEKAKISYLHQEKIQSLFKKHIQGYLEIDHFSLNIFYGKKQSLFFSPTPEMASELCKYNFVDKDSNYKPEVYKNFCIYSWKSVARHSVDDSINFIKEKKFGMNAGMMIVRPLSEECYAMYSFATHRKDRPEYPGQYNLLFALKINEIAELGDFFYDSMYPEVSLYTEAEGVKMPNLASSEPFDVTKALSTATEKDLYEALKYKDGVRINNLISEKSFLDLNVNHGFLLRHESKIDK